MNFLHDLFKTKLENECNLTYVRSFQIVGKHSARGYHLFFGTRHKRGLEKMKEAMWKAAPLSGARFEDSTDPNALVLFGSEVDTGPLVWADLSSAESDWIRWLRLAHVVYNRFDRAEFVKRTPTPVVSEGREVCLVEDYQDIHSQDASHVLYAGG